MEKHLVGKMFAISEGKDFLLKSTLYSNFFLMSFIKCRLTFLRRF